MSTGSSTSALQNLRATSRPGESAGSLGAKSASYRVGSVITLQPRLCPHGRTIMASSTRTVTGAPCVGAPGAAVRLAEGCTLTAPAVAQNALVCARTSTGLPRPGAGFGYPPGRTPSAMLVAAAVGPGHGHHLVAASAVPGQVREQYPTGEHQRALAVCRQQPGHKGAPRTARRRLISAQTAPRACPRAPPRRVSRRLASRV